MKCWLSDCDEAMRIRMDGGAVGVQIEQQCRSAMLLFSGCGHIMGGWERVACCSECDGCVVREHCSLVEDYMFGKTSVSMF